MFNVKIYDHVLSEKEVKEESKLKILHYKCDQNKVSNDILGDASEYNNSAQLTTSAPQ
jgi:hypothetical protein